jgi:hypothetical protein
MKNATTKTTTETVKSLKKEIANLEQEKSVLNKMTKRRIEQLNKVIKHQDISLIDRSIILNLTKMGQIASVERAERSEAKCLILERIISEMRETINTLKDEKEMLRLNVREYDNFLADVVEEEYIASTEGLPLERQVKPIRRMVEKELRFAANSWSDIIPAPSRENLSPLEV